MARTPDPGVQKWFEGSMDRATGQFSHLASQVSRPGTGATVNIRTGEHPASGWAVAMAGHEHLEPTESFGPASLTRYAIEHEKALGQTGHLGLWHQPGAGVYQDVSKVLPNTYPGGVKAIASGYLNRQQSVYNIDRGQTLSMKPGKGEKRETRSAMKSLRSQAPQRRVADMPTSQLGAALRGRHEI